MSILKGHDSDTIQRQPYDEKGRFVLLECIYLDCTGTLKFQGGKLWACDGLRDPERDDQELIACEFGHFDGEQRWEANAP